MISSRKIWQCVVVSCLTITVGCESIWHELKPHRMQRLNRGPAPSIDPDFGSIGPKRSTSLADTGLPTEAATVSVNRAEVTHIRAQSPSE